MWRCFSDPACLPLHPKEDADDFVWRFGDDNDAVPICTEQGLSIPKGRERGWVVIEFVIATAYNASHMG